MDVFIGQAYCKKVYYLYGKTRHFIYKCPNQKAQIRAVLYTITSEERQAWVDKVRKLDESSAKKEQPTKEASLKENFIKAQA